MWARCWWWCAPTGRQRRTCARRSACSTPAIMSACCSTAPRLRSTAASSAPMMAMAMRAEFSRLLGLFLGLWLALAAVAANAQADAPRSGVSYDPPALEGQDIDQTDPDARAPAPRERRQRSRIGVEPSLAFDQVLSADLNGGGTFTHTVAAAGVAGRIEPRRVRAQASYRYQRNIDWSGPDSDTHSGLAIVNADVVPG